MGWMAALIPMLTAALSTGATAAGTGAAAAAPAAAGAAGAAGTAASALPAAAGTAAAAAPIAASALPSAAGTAGAVGDSSGGLGAMQALWQHIQGLRGSLPTALGGAPPSTPLDPGTGYVTGGPGTNTLTEQTAANPSTMTPAGPVMPVNNPLAAIPTPAQSQGPSNATKLAQYATAMKALNNMGTGEGEPKPQASSFSASAGGGPNKGLPPSNVGPIQPPPGPVTSAGTFLLSPAGRAAMARLKLSMGGSLAA